MLSKILKQARENQKKSIYQIARALNIDSALISKYENGKRLPTKIQVSQLAEILEVDKEDLLKYWLSEKVLQVVDGEEYAVDALLLTKNSLEDKKQYGHQATGAYKLLQEIDERSAQHRFTSKNTKNTWEDLNVPAYIYAVNYIAGNDHFTVEQIQLILEKGMTIGGKSMRDHLDILNHHKTIVFLQSMLPSGSELNRSLWVECAQIFNNEIQNRVIAAKLAGSDVLLLAPDRIREEMEQFWQFVATEEKNKHPIVFAIDLLEKLLFIAPLSAGNTQLAWLMMNFILLKNAYPGIYLPAQKDQQMQYYTALEKAWTFQNKEDLYLLIFEQIRHVLINM